MTQDAHLARLAEAHGIVTSYRDLQGQERVAVPDTLRALLAANGIAAENPSQVSDSLAALQAERKERHYPQSVVVVSRRKTALPFGSATGWELRSEDGDELASGGPTDAIELPAMASGIHALQVGREEVRVLVAPGRAPGVSDRLWGVNLALYGLRSDRNAGLGDYSDLSRMAGVAGQAGAAFIGINPVHAIGNADAGFSPYSPSHRGFFNTAHIALDAIPGLHKSPGALDTLSKSGMDLERLRAASMVDYEGHRTAHRRLLTALHDVFLTEAPDRTRYELAAFRAAGGGELERFARFEALSERLGEDWRTWPPQPGEPEPVRVDFHIWLQWIANHQLERAAQAAQNSGMALGLYLDLAVGARRDGAESWCERDSIAQKVSIGAPPDHLSPEGQNWDLTAYAPGKLAALNYRPFRQLLAATMRHAGMVRIDHVLGLSRSFWIPDDGSPGGYVRQPLEELVAVLKIEAERHGVVVIGEDLGLVPTGFRDTMQENGIYGYSVLQYERDGAGLIQRPPSASDQVLSCFSTHDTPTVRGFEIGRDIDWWARLGWTDEIEETRARAQRSADVDALGKHGPSKDFSRNVPARLARSSAAMVTVQLDDILEHEEAQNLPGTVDEHVNWRRKYGVAVDALAGDQRFQATANVMNEDRGANRIPRTEEMTHDS